MPVYMDAQSISRRSRGYFIPTTNDYPTDTCPPLILSQLDGAQWELPLTSEMQRHLVLYEPPLDIIPSIHTDSVDASAIPSIVEPVTDTIVDSLDPSLLSRPLDTDFSGHNSFCTEESRNTSFQCPQGTVPVVAHSPRLGDSSTMVPISIGGASFRQTTGELEKIAIPTRNECRSQTSEPFIGSASLGHLSSSPMTAYSSLSSTRSPSTPMSTREPISWPAFNPLLPLPPSPPLGEQIWLLRNPSDIRIPPENVNVELSANEQYSIHSSHQGHVLPVVQTNYVPGRMGVYSQSAGHDQETSPVDTILHPPSFDQSSTFIAYMPDDILSAHSSLQKKQVAPVALVLALNRRRRRDGKFVCELCSATFTAKHNLKNHMNSHLGVKNFECTSCRRAFGTPHVLKRHRKACMTRKLHSSDLHR